MIFDALSQETRLRAFRLLVEAGSDGLAAGAISEALGTPHNTLSFHLSHLTNAGIIHKDCDQAYFLCRPRDDALNVIGVSHV